MKKSESNLNKNEVRNVEEVRGSIYIDDFEAARKLNITVERLRVKICRGEPLPPYIHPPGIRKRFWIESEVDEWLNKYKFFNNAA